VNPWLRVRPSWHRLPSGVVRQRLKVADHEPRNYVPLLRVMREIQGVPRGQPSDFNGMKRFRHFVRRIFPRKKNGQIDENAVYLMPLLAINPMAKDHVTALLDDADDVGARVAAEVAARLAVVPGDYKVGLVLADDLMGAVYRSKPLPADTWRAGYRSRLTSRRIED
jgi:hypothetical protein